MAKSILEMEVVKYCFIRSRFHVPRNMSDWMLLRRHNLIYVYKDSDKLPQCQIPGCKCGARYDARLPQGTFGFICHAHARQLNIGMGLGVGQAIILQSEYEEISRNEKEVEKALRELSPKQVPEGRDNSEGYIDAGRDI